MIDVLTKLREIAERSPEEIGRAIAAAEKMSGNPVSEASEAQKAAREKFKNMLNGKKDDDKDGEKKTESSGKKPDYLDFDKDGDKKEPMTKALKDKEEKKVDEAKGKKPDFLDMDKDGDEKEPMSKAVKDKEDKKVDEDVQITLSGSDAVLAEILKLAGQIGAKTTKGPEAAGPMGGPAPMGAPAPALPAPTGMPSSGPIPSLASMMGDEPSMPSVGDGMAMDTPMDVDIGGPSMGPGGEEPGMGDDPMMDSAFDASTTPNPTTMGMGAAIPSGNDLSKPKMTAPRVSPGDNPLHSATSFG